ncbi:MAG: hypothetical protein JO147_01555 [Actinobacteria bacterium]|nr:hypothetical protein [Actinomycetota bacterium]
MKLEWWEELADEQDDDIFNPALDASYDLTRPSSKAAELVRELVDFCGLEELTDELEDPIDENDWKIVVDEIKACLEPED